MLSDITVLLQQWVKPNFISEMLKEHTSHSWSSYRKSICGNMTLKSQFTESTITLKKTLSDFYACLQFILYRAAQ